MVLSPSTIIIGVTFSLTGNDSIPTDGSGRVLITDIGPNVDDYENNEDALICRSEIPIGIPDDGVGDWYLHPTEMSTDHDTDRIDPTRVS